MKFVNFIAEEFNLDNLFKNWDQFAFSNKQALKAFKTQCKSISDKYCEAHNIELTKDNIHDHLNALVNFYFHNLCDQIHELNQQEKYRYGRCVNLHALLEKIKEPGQVDINTSSPGLKNSR